MSEIDSSGDPSDLLWGAAEIGKAIRRDASKTFYLLRTGKLPAKKVGGQWVASRKRLLAIADPAGPAP